MLSLNLISIPTLLLQNKCQNTIQNNPKLQPYSTHKIQIPNQSKTLTLPKTLNCSINLNFQIIIFNQNGLSFKA